MANRALLPFREKDLEDQALPRPFRECGTHSDRGRADRLSSPAYAADDDERCSWSSRTRSTRAHQSHASQRHDSAARKSVSATARLSAISLQLGNYVNRTAVAL